MKGNSISRLEYGKNSPIVRVGAYLPPVWEEGQYTPPLIPNRACCKPETCNKEGREQQGFLVRFPFSSWFTGQTPSKSSWGNPSVAPGVCSQTKSHLGINSFLKPFSEIFLSASVRPGPELSSRTQIQFSLFYARGGFWGLLGVFA